MSQTVKLISSETRELTPELATEFSQMPASITERELNPKRSKYLKDVLVNGSALAFMWARAKVRSDGITYRVNGHHSSTEAAKLNGQLPAGLKVHIDDYEVADVHDLAFLFRQFDNRISSRSVSDISGAYQMLVHGLRNVPKLAGQKAIEAVAWYENAVVGSDVPKGDDRYTMFNDSKYHEFIHMVSRIYSKKTPEFSVIVLGAMYGCYDRAPKEAEEFWSDVARNGNGRSDTDPATVLDRWLYDVYDTKGPKPKQWEVYQACALAWNAFRNGRTLERIPRYNAKKGRPDLE
jgi:hypothetical protein